MNPVFEFVLAILFIVFAYKLINQRMHQKNLRICAALTMRTESLGNSDSINWKSA